MTLYLHFIREEAEKVVLGGAEFKLNGKSGA